MKPWTSSRPPISSKYTGKPCERKPALAKSPPPSWVADGYFSSVILSPTFVLSTLIPDQDRKFSLMKENHYVVQAT